MASVTTKQFLYAELQKAFDPEVIFKLHQVYQLMLNDIDHDMYDGHQHPDSTIRRDLQELRDDNLITFADYDGSYYINKPINFDPKENIFDLEALKQNGRIFGWSDKIKDTTAPGVNFERWMIAHKDEVMSHKIARELDIPCQTRVGSALFLQTIDQIRDDIIENGYDYRCYQPAIEELPQPIEYKGKVYKYIVRDGNNRYELPWDYFPCALIKSEDEYSSLQFGAMANNPTKDKKNDCTPDDVKQMIRLGFKYGKIAKDEDSVYNVLAERYKETRKKDRRQFVSEILGEEGIKVSIEPYDIKKAEKHLSENYGVELNPETDYVVGWGRESDHYRKYHSIFEWATSTPGIQLNEYAFLEMGQGVTTQPTEENADEQRIILESGLRKYVKHCCKVADQYRSGELKMPNRKWLSQVNETEKFNEFQ